MHESAAIHGGTDGGPEPLYDFSTNANPLPPPPGLIEAVRQATFTRYPDPEYTALRESLAAAHGVSPDRIVVGAGASELILRLVRRHSDPVAVLGPTFSEYARCARLENRPLLLLEDPELLARISKRCLAFVCRPNNPTGDLWALDPLGKAAALHTLVIDLAYAPLCNIPPEPGMAALVSRCICLHSPNKAFGLTGVRAAYAVLPAPDAALAGFAPSWVLDASGVAFLGATIEPAAQAWLAASLPTIAALRHDLATGLRKLGCEVRESPATFLLARVGHATPIARALRKCGLRVRDATSFGLPDHLRLCAAPIEAQRLLLTSLAVHLRSRDRDKTG